jgi:hypothetical protein
LELLLRAEHALVIIVGWGAHSGLSGRDPWYLDRSSYDRKLSYGKSKLANILFAYELARRLQSTQVVSNAVDPGGVATNLGRNNGLLSWCRHLMYYALKGQLVGPRRGAETVIHLAISSSLHAVSGKYFYEKREIQSSPASYDVLAAASLWSLSIELTNLDERLGAAWQLIRPIVSESTNVSNAAFPLVSSLLKKTNELH